MLQAPSMNGVGRLPNDCREGNIEIASDRLFKGAHGESRESSVSRPRETLVRVVALRLIKEAGGVGKRAQCPVCFGLSGTAPLVLAVGR